MGGQSRQFLQGKGRQLLHDSREHVSLYGILGQPGLGQQAEGGQEQGQHGWVAGALH